MNHSFNTTIAKEYGLAEAILLENIYFWCKKNEANKKLINGRPFTYNSVRAFNNLFDYLSPSSISRALKNLEDKGLVDVGCFNTNQYDRTKWYCITDKAKEYFEPKKNDEKLAEPEKSNTPEEKVESEDSENGFAKNENSICQNEKSNDEKCKMLITDINTDKNTNINSDINFNGKAEKKKSKRVSKPKPLSKSQQAQEFLNTLSEKEQEDYKECARVFYNFKKSIRDTFETSEATLICWQSNFAKCAEEFNVSSNEILNTLIFAISNDYWKQYMFSPDNFRKSFEKLYQQKTYSNQKSNTSSYKPKQNFMATEKYSLGDILGDC